jgi:hypothetical protein
MQGSPKYYFARRPEVVGYDDGRGPRELRARHDLANLSPVFDWGRSTPGTAQLAIAILADAAGDKFALAHYVRFAREFLAGAPYERWTLNGDKVAEWCKAREAVCV